MNSVVVPPPDVADSARGLAVQGDREAAVYATHERLEDDLAKLPILFADVKKYTSSSIVNPWEPLATTISALTSKVTLCLQLLGTGVKIQRAKGLRTVSTLYDAQKSVADRLKTFWLIIQDAFVKSDIIDSFLPAPVALKFAEAIRAYDAKQAAEWLSCTVQYLYKLERMLKEKSVTSKDLSQHEDVRLFRLVLLGTDVVENGRQTNARENLLLSKILTNLIKCKAESGQTCSEIHDKQCDLRAFMTDEALESLLRFEKSCLLLMQGKRQRMRLMAEARTAEARGGGQISAVPPHEEKRSVPPQTDDSSRVGFLQRIVQHMESLGWAQPHQQNQPLRLVFIIAAFLLLCVLVRKMLGVVGGMKSIMGTSYGSRRALTL